ncbi:hypothetical protein [Paraburkholderia kirstenboschensis]|uniref:Uncharacterized protein n=1 Tax=Paraburkholderia kirstenboschensis TaxID=1245436 RepID=A0ABZ0EIB8_9BURK|nr:hypothetical protein [Paraburkholderia kirstenboschensis]WOD16962.1 hypothetical protein RW095_13960 [Paraburkholderia kirstenboschensis]
MFLNTLTVAVPSRIASFESKTAQFYTATLAATAGLPHVFTQLHDQFPSLQP